MGVAVDLFGEGGSLTGEQRINETLINESFQLGTLSFSGSAWLLFQHSERLRYGPGLRGYGFYGSSTGRPFAFGPLFEGFALAEYALPMVEQFEALLTGRAGLALLIPGGDFANEITRLQREGVGVWGVPRTGWLAGVGFGTRRRMAEHLWLRADLGAQYTQLFLFATDERVDDLRFRKGWSTSVLRVGLQLGVELSL